MKIIEFFNRSIQRKLLFGFFLVILSSLIILGMFLYNNYIRVIQKREIEYNTKMLKSAAFELENFLNQVEKMSINIAYHSDIQKILMNFNEQSALGKMKNEMIFNNTVNNMNFFFGFQKYIKGVYVLKDGQPIYYSGQGIINKDFDFLSVPWYGKAINHDEMFTPMHQRNYIHFIDTLNKSSKQPAIMNNYISYVKKVNLDRGNSSISLYFLTIDFNIVKLHEIFQPYVEEAGNIFKVIDADGRIIYDSNMENIGNYIDSTVYSILNIEHENGYRIVTIQQKKLVSYSKVKGTDYYFFSIKDYNTLIHESRKLKMFTYTIIFLSIVIAFMISIFIASGILKPIKILREKMLEIEKGNLEVTAPLDGTDEVGDLSKGFNDMVGELRRLIDEVYQRRINEKQAQLNALQAQINPHFLYNTLDTIGSIGYVKDVAEITTVAESLSDMFKYSIKNTGKMVRLQDEINHVKNYLSIINVRYENKIKSEFHIANELLFLKTLKLILQPIVENAVYHGLELKKENSILMVKAAVIEQCLLIKIKDNGKGMDSSCLYSIIQSLNNSYYIKYDSCQYKKCGIGIKNVHDRIRMSFGESYGIMIESKIGIGTTVTIKIPVLK